jgi:hypothetical protein
MNAAQQQIMAEWNQGMQQAGAELQALHAQTAEGCRALVAQHPMDLEPLVRALRAVEVQASALKSKGAEPVPDIYDRLRNADPNGPRAEVERALAQVHRAKRDFKRWADEQWMRLESTWMVAELHAMWPHVEAAITRPLSCERCGAPITRQNPRQSESITCHACGAVNQVTTHAMVEAYFRMSYFLDEASVIDKLMALRKFKDDWQDVRDLEFASGRGRPDEPLDRLERLEQLERDYWSAHFQARVRNQGGSAEDVAKFVDERMRLQFYAEMSKNDVWRAAHDVPAAVGAPAPGQAAAPGLMEPIEGVSVELYGQLEAKRSNADPAEFVQHLAQHQMDQAKFDRIAKAWCDRMAHDPSNAVYAEYSKGLLSQAAASADSVSFEKFCEIQGAWNAWGKQGKDAGANLQQHFALTATDFSNIAMTWMQKMSATPSMFEQFARLSAEAEQKYLAMP